MGMQCYWGAVKACYVNPSLTMSTPSNKSRKQTYDLSKFKKKKNCFNLLECRLPEKSIV